MPGREGKLKVTAKPTAAKPVKVAYKMDYTPKPNTGIVGRMMAGIKSLTGS